MKRRLLPLFFLGLLGLGCGPAPVQSQTNLRIDSVWGEQLDHVILYFVQQGDASTSCDTLELSGALAAEYMNTCPAEDPCTVKVLTVNADPGSEGKDINLPIGEMNLLAYGFDDLDNNISHDCVSVSVQNGKTTEISLSL